MRLGSCVLVGISVHFRLITAYLPRYLFVPNPLVGIGFPLGHSVDRAGER